MNRYLEMLKSEKSLPHEPAKPAKVPTGGLAGFAGAQGELFLKNETVPAASEKPSFDHKTERIPDYCMGALRDPVGGLFLPWGPYLTADDVRRLRAELFTAIVELADAERWTRERYNDTVARAARGPLADLLPNIEYFSAKVRELRAEATVREVMAARAWKYDSRIR
ncbi:hypothetical protein OKW45_003405 [Paraburkholderia sp. WSM4175]|uniref:hypothetical protein n=1 Tax=Paraburkholderia sp. WSM4175 TaxID=2991072 RepID=UPI003D2094C3